MSDELEKNADETAIQPGSVEETNEEIIENPNVSEDKTKLEEERQRRERAENKIVEMKRKLKDAGIEENPDVNEVVEEALNKRLDALKAIASQNEAKLQKENSELRETIKSKAGTSNSAAGSNQVKPNAEEEIKLSPADREFMLKAGITIEQVKETIRKKKLTN